MFCAYFDSLTCTRVFITSLSFRANRAVYRTIISSILRRWIITRTVSRVISPSASYRARIPCTPISPNTIYCFIYMLYQYLSSLSIYYNSWFNKIREARSIFILPLTRTGMFVAGLTLCTVRTVYRTVISTKLRQRIIACAVSWLISYSASNSTNVPVTPFTPNPINCFYIIIY